MQSCPISRRVLYRFQPKALPRLGDYHPLIKIKNFHFFKFLLRSGLLLLKCIVIVCVVFSGGNEVLKPREWIT